MASRQEQRDLYQDLQDQLADIERQQQDDTLPHSDQALLDQAWEDITQQIEELEELFEMQDEADWRDAQEFFDEEDEYGYDQDDDYKPGPQSVTVRCGLAVRNGKVKVVTFAPPPPKPMSNAGAGADEPRPKSPERLVISPEELARLNAMTDNRSCARCSGCQYCTKGAGYDGADEV